MGGFCENVNINYIAGRSQFVKTSCQSAISLTSERRERERFDSCAENIYYYYDDETQERAIK